MNYFRYVSCWLSACVLILLIFWWPANAADKPADFRAGERIEAKQGADWFAGVVVSIDKNSKWIEVRLDDVPNFMPGSAESVRERALKTSVPAIHLRRPAQPVAAAKPAAKPPAKPLAEAATLPPPGQRVWQDRSGKFKVAATYQGMKDDKVILQDEKGKRIEIPLNRLSDDDAKFVKAQQQKSEDGNPFEDFDLENSPSVAVADSDKPTLQPKTETVKRTSPKVIQPTANKEWSCKAIARQVALNAQAFGNGVNLGRIPDSNSFFEKLTGLYVSDDGSQVVVVRQQGLVGTGRFYFQSVDLVAQQSGPLIPLPLKTKVLDISTTENLVACGTEHFGFGKNSTLIIARPKDNQLAIVAKWDPYASEDWEPNRDLKSAWLLPGRKVMTLGSQGKTLTIWDIDKRQPLWIIAIESASFLKLVFSQDRRFLAMDVSNGIAVIDLVAGEHVGTLPAANRSHWHDFTFRSDGMRLCGMGERGLFEYDLTTGEQTHEFSHSLMRGSSTIAYAGDFVLFENRYLFDIDREILLWEYTGQELAQAHFRDGRMWAASSVRHTDQAPMLSTAAMPHSRAIQVANKLGTREQLLVARPGDAVAIKIEVDAAIAPADEVRKAIAANLTQAGFKVVEQADLLVTAICQRMETQTIKINTGTDRFNPKPDDVVERSITPHASFITMTLRGEKVWESGYLATPGFVIFLERDESLDQALVRLTSPNINLIKNARFNVRMTRLGTATKDGAYGTSLYATGE